MRENIVLVNIHQKKVDSILNEYPNILAPYDNLYQEFIDEIVLRQVLGNVRGYVSPQDLVDLITKCIL